MYYLHWLLRYVFAAMAGLLFGTLLLAACTIIGFVLLFTPFPPIQLLALFVLATGVCLFALGVKIAFAWGSHFYKTHIQGDTANPLLHKIDRLPPSLPIALFNKNEIDQLQKISEYKNQLDKYLHDIDDCCPTSQEPFSSETQFVTITGITRRVQDGVGIITPFTKTYEKNSIREWIKIRGEDAKEPQIGCDLNDPINKIEFHPGFAPWIYEFIQTVRPLLTCSSHITIQNQIKERKEPTENTAIKIQENMPAKAKTALLRQQYYRNLFVINTPVNAENRELAPQQPKMIFAK